MRIQKATVYNIGGATFDSEQKARDWIYDQIGNLFDSALSKAGVGSMGPKERLASVDAFTRNAAQFAVLLSAFSAAVERQ